MIVTPEITTGTTRPMMAVTCPGCHFRAELMPVAALLEALQLDYALDGGQCLKCNTEYQFAEFEAYLPAMRAAHRTALRLQREGR